LAFLRRKSKEHHYFW